MFDVTIPLTSSTYPKHTPKQGPNTGYVTFATGSVPALRQGAVVALI